ncbi:hypothetical protein Pcinc_029053 [Petrolisthes cinctipes]|uniref:C2H2-type domain-containing protein n=1 Tax=Petrolisthes cinctipes TaxID=88211 RepID=A0AAE1K6G0_PETCI|nr:hypothetical protein Pcinc_029053 [Petrolisthes cinctipes]
MKRQHVGLLLCEGWLATGLWGGRGRNWGRGEGGESGSGGAPATHACPKCGRCYTLRSNLSRHMRLECGVERRYSCTFCHKRFSHAHHLRSHERSIHAHAAATPTPAPTATQSS